MQHPTEGVSGGSKREYLHRVGAVCALCRVLDQNRAISLPEGGGVRVFCKVRRVPCTSCNACKMLLNDIVREQHRIVSLFFDALNDLFLGKFSVNVLTWFRTMSKTPM